MKGNHYNDGHWLKMHFLFLLEGNLVEFLENVPSGLRGLAVVAIISIIVHKGGHKVLQGSFLKRSIFFIFEWESGLQSLMVSL